MCSIAMIHYTIYGRATCIVVSHDTCHQYVENYFILAYNNAHLSSQLFQCAALDVLMYVFFLNLTKLQVMINSITLAISGHEALTPLGI